MSEWIPVSERPPEDLQEVIITWANKKPVTYYEHIKDVPFVGCAVYYKRRWYWYTVTVKDYLAEYGERGAEALDKAIEVMAWMPLPEPYVVTPDIIYCRDCEWFGKAGCAIDIADDSDRPKETDYCSFAERRTDQPEE